MSNPYHLVVRAPVAMNLSRDMQWFQATHVRRYHKHYGSSGHLWQERYKSFAVENDDQLLTVIRYVEANPVRANMVESAAGWLWSSHLEHCELLGTGPEGVPLVLKNKAACLRFLPIELPQPWTAYVDTPMTGRELATVKKRVEVH